MRYLFIFIFISTLFFVACSSVRESTPTAAPINDYKADVTTVTLPITQQWSTWLCSDGSQLQTRFTSTDKKTLELQDNGQNYLLQHQPSTDPIIYHNAQRAFFSDGHIAVVGMPIGSNIYHAGCRPQ